MSVHDQQEYPVAGVAGGRQPHWQVSCWEPPPPGGRGQKHCCQSARPTLNAPLHAHRTLKGAAAIITQRSAVPGCCLQLKGFPKQDINDVTTWKWISGLVVIQVMSQK